MNFDRKTCKKMRIEMDKALMSVADKYGVAIRTGNMSYSDTNISAKIEISNLNEKGQVETPEMIALRDRFPNLVGYTFMDRGKKFTVCGFKPRRRKYPILASSDNNKIFKYSLSFPPLKEGLKIKSK